jgi:hypothetical protein
LTDQVDLPLVPPAPEPTGTGESAGDGAGRGRRLNPRRRAPA